MVFYHCNRTEGGSVCQLSISGMLYLPAKTALGSRGLQVVGLLSVRYFSQLCSITIKSFQAQSLEGIQESDGQMMGSGHQKLLAGLQQFLLTTDQKCCLSKWSTYLNGQKKTSNCVECFCLIITNKSGRRSKEKSVLRNYLIFRKIFS